MITCGRCGKENQDHYKFCLGCGAKLEAKAAPVAVAPKPEPASAPPSGPAAVAPSLAVPIPPGPVTPTPIGVARTAPPPNPNSFASGAPRPTGFQAKPAASAPRPAEASGQIGGGQLVSAAPSAPAPVFEAPVAMTPPPRNPTPPPAVAPASDTIVCPGCGKTVAAAYTFCGSCGYRMKGAAPQAPAAVAAANLGAQRTMFMAPQAKPAPTPRGHLTLIRPDGNEGGMHPLMEGENLIGRGQAALFDADPYLSPRHAEFLLTGDSLQVRDLKSLNGVFIKISEEESLESGDIFRIGQELLRFDVITPPTPLEDGTEVIGTPNPGFWGRITVIVGRDVDGPAFPIFEESIVLGRERGDILFPEDGYVSATHARITLRDGHVYLSDLGSSNGTFYRTRGTRKVVNGAQLLMGQQLFRVAYR